MCSAFNNERELLSEIKSTIYLHIINWLDFVNSWNDQMSSIKQECPCSFPNLNGLIHVGLSIQSKWSNCIVDNFGGVRTLTVIETKLTH